MKMGLGQSKTRKLNLNRISIQKIEKKPLKRLKMGFKQVSNGDWYWFNKRSVTSELLVKDNDTSGYLTFIKIPKHLIGKKVRLKLEIVEKKGDE
jgi:hypothetical protein